jgi:hypothetical protein
MSLIMDHDTLCAEMIYLISFIVTWPYFLYIFKHFFVITL